jgi:signal transduction histidine kinase
LSLRGCILRARSLLAQSGGEALGCLALATASGLLLAQILLRPTARDLRSLAAYLVLSGAVTLALGWFALRLAEKSVALGIRAKLLLIGLVGSGVGLINVFVIAKLMFLSTQHDLRLLVALLVFSGVLTVSFNIWVAATTATRIGLVAASIRELAAEGNRDPVAARGGDEVAALSVDVDELTGRLRQADEERAALERERRELTAGASHDLRTPLSSLRAMVDALEDRVVDDPEEVARYYTVMRRELERLNRMVDDLFELAQMDAGALRLNRCRVSVQEIAAEVVDAMQAQASRSDLALTFHVDGVPPELELDGVRVERALANLVRNALEHTPAGGSIGVTVASREEWIDIAVSDTGEGIHPRDLPRIWDRFYRAERSRSRDAKTVDGAGLGLAIVRGVAEAHGGSVDVRSTPGAGSFFTLRLPRELAQTG